MNAPSAAGLIAGSLETAKKAKQQLVDRGGALSLDPVSGAFKDMATAQMPAAYWQNLRSALANSENLRTSSRAPAMNMDG